MNIKAGDRYQRFKGGMYEIVCVAKHSETMEEYVVYKALYDNQHSKYWVRPRAMFEEYVTRNGVTQQRFKKI